MYKRQPYNPRHRWDETRRHGAGLAALARLGSSMGYRLVGCDSHGVNAFFVVSSQSQSFSHRSVRDHYVGPRYGLPFGHPRHAYPVSYTHLDVYKRQVPYLDEEGRTSPRASRGTPRISHSSGDQPRSPMS